MDGPWRDLWGIGAYANPSHYNRVQPIGGALWLKYKAMGYERSCLGYPTTGEFSRYAGEVVQYFNGGVLAWTAGKATAHCHNGKTY